MKRFFLGIFVFCLWTFLSADTKPALPDGAKGFSGKICGKVISKEKNGFVIHVQKIDKIWKKNTAKNPSALVGKNVLVNVQWVKGQNGKWNPHEGHVRYVNRLKVGDEICVEVVNDEGERLHILELPKETADTKPALPDGAKGFSGKICGKVISKEKNGFVIHVQKIDKIWKKNTAKNPSALVGKNVLVNVQWVKGQNGKWNPHEGHVRYVNHLKVGDEICVEVVNDEGERLHILELPKEK